MQSTVKPNCRWMSVCGLLLLCLWVSVQSVHAMMAPGVSGSYSVTVKGSYTGEGTIAVGAASVTINLKVTGNTGQTGVLLASNLKLVDGRFVGKGTVLGVAMTISGRIDLADTKGPLKAATIQATFATDANTGGRIVGTRRGGGS